MRRKFDPSRGGHAPGHLRDAFLGHLDEIGYRFPDPDAEIEVEVGYEPRRVPLRWLLGQLWNCTDTLPGEYRDLLQLPGRGTYAAAVRHIVASSR